jgi:hypothetical protein
MSKFSINYDSLKNSINKQKVYKYSEVKDKLVKVAWDVVKFNCDSEDIDGLWKVQTTPEGEVIVAMYDSEGLSAESQSEKVLTAVASSWEVVPSRDKESINIFYKDEAVKKIASSDMGIKREDVPSFCRDIAAKLDNDDKLRKSLINELSEGIKAALLTKYPELTK